MRVHSLEVGGFPEFGSFEVWRTPNFGRFVFGNVVNFGFALEIDFLKKNDLEGWLFKAHDISEDSKLATLRLYANAIEDM